MLIIINTRVIGRRPDILLLSLSETLALLFEPPVLNVSLVWSYQLVWNSNGCAFPRGKRTKVRREGQTTLGNRLVQIETKVQVRNKQTVVPSRAHCTGYRVSDCRLSVREQPTLQAASGLEMAIHPLDCDCGDTGIEDTCMLYGSAGATGWRLLHALESKASCPMHGR